MKRPYLRVTMLVLALLAVAVLSGCTVTSEETQSEVNVGNHLYAEYQLNSSSGFPGSPPPEVVDLNPDWDYYINGHPYDPSIDTGFIINTDTDRMLVSYAVPSGTYEFAADTDHDGLIQDDLSPFGSSYLYELDWEQKATAVKVDLDKNLLLVGEDSYTVKGTVKRPNGKLLSGVVDVLVVDSDENVVATSLAINGAFELDLPAGDLTPNTEYHVQLDLDDLLAVGANLMTPVTPVTLAYRYDLNLDSPPTLTLGDTNKLIHGRLVDSKGAGVRGAAVMCPYADSDVTRSDGSFILTLNDIDEAGDIDITVFTAEQVVDEAIPYQMLAVNSAPLDSLTVVKAVVHTAFEENLQLKAEVDGNDVTQTTWFTFSGIKIWANSVNHADELGSSHRIIDEKLSEHTGDFYTKLVMMGDPGDLMFAEKGTLTIQASGDYTGSVTVEVKDPADLNLRVNPITEMGDPVELRVAQMACDLSIEAFDAKGNAVPSFDWELSGTGFETNLTKGDEASVTGIHLLLVSGGKLTVTITGYDEEGNQIGVASQDIEIEGWTYTITPGEFTVNQKADYTVVLRNLDGEPVNNAIVYLANSENDYSCSAADTNINNGTYVVKDVVFDRVDGELKLEAVTLGDFTPMVWKPLDVQPAMVYTLEVTNSKITAGVKTDLTVKVLRDGEPVEGLEDSFDIRAGEASIASFGEVTYDPETESYTIPEAVISIYEDTDLKAVNLEVRTSDEETGHIYVYAGKQPLEVFLPTVTINPAPLTYMYEEDVTVTITDPQTGKPIKTYVGFDGTDIGAIIEVDGEEVYSSPLSWEPLSLPLAEGDWASQYSFKAILVPYPEVMGELINQTVKIAPELLVDYLETEDGGEVYFTQNVLAGPAQLNLDKTIFYMGYANPTAITLKNARGEALNGYTVYRGGGDVARLVDESGSTLFWSEVENQEPIGVLDENGALLYSFTPANTGKAYFTAGTDFDTDAVMLAQANSDEDLNGPAINVALPATTTDTSIMLTGTITDDTRVANVYVNNARVAIIPGTSTTFVYELPLVDGANVVSIIALDANGNGTSYMGTISKVAPTPKSVSVTIGKVDANAGLDVPAYAENGRTMVPLAFVAKTLGGSAEWDAATNTVKIVLGGKTVVVTIGSKNATVNGAPTTLMAPATARDGRTFVALADLANLLGATTSWDEATQTATVVMP